MRRKSFKGISGLAVLIFAALALVLVGCKQPVTDTTVTEIKINEKHTLPAPGNVKVTAYPGVNVVTWDLVKDADSYTVIRTDSKGKVEDLGTDEAIGYLDQVSFSNQLINGETYTYTVKANSSFYNTSLATAQAEATIPARTNAAVSPVKVPAEAGITVTAAALNGADFLEVLWEDAADTVSFANYSVDYLYSSEAGTASSLKGSITSDSANKSPIHRVLFPLIGGTPVIKVTGSWGSDAYYAPVSVTKTAAAVTPTVLPQVTGVSANRSTTGPKTTVDLTWNKVGGATGYSVYRSERASTSSSISSGNGDILSWQGVDVGTPVTENGTSLKAQDTNADLDKNYIYLIVATNTAGAKSSSPGISNVVAAASETLATPVVSVNISDVTTKKVAVSWDIEDGVTYTLARTVITQDSGSSWIEGTYESVTTVSDTKADNQRTVITTLPDYRQSYRFKLTATKGGLTKTGTAIINTNPFNATGVSVNNFSAIPSSTAKALNITVQLGYQEYFDDLSAKLYRAESNSNGTEIGAWTAVGSDQSFDANNRQFVYTNSSLDPTKYYVYKVEIYTGTTSKTLLVRTTGLFTTPPAQPSPAN
jgi:hypothetical protein